MQQSHGLFAIAKLLVYTDNIYHWRSGMCNSFGRVYLSVCLSVSLYVCMYVCQTITFKRRVHWTCVVFPRSAGRVRIWRSSCQGRRQCHRSQKGRKFLFPECKNSINNNSRSIKHTGMTFACSTGFLDTADRMMWPPSLSRDRIEWPRVTLIHAFAGGRPYIRRQSCY